MHEWVIEGRLARTCRPGRFWAPVGPVPAAAVEEWLAAAEALGVRSVLCLLADDQLAFYEQHLPGGLLGVYRTAGLAVGHVPVRDHSQPPLSPEQLAAVWRLFREMPSPVLVHCSAGVDRTGAAVAHIQAELRAAEAAPDCRQELLAPFRVRRVDDPSVAREQ